MKISKLTFNGEEFEVSGDLPRFERASGLRSVVKNPFHPMRLTQRVEVSGKARFSKRALKLFGAHYRLSRRRKKVGL